MSYLNPESINGLNLYAYCGNNPIMRIDPYGNSFLLVLGGVIIGGLISGISSAFSAAEGENRFGAFLGDFVNGAISTLGLAAAIATGGIGGFVIAAGTGFVGGLLGNATSQKVSYGDIQWDRALISGGINAFMNSFAFLGLSQAGIYTGGTWMSRFVEAASLSALGAGVSGYFASLPIFNVNEGRTSEKAYNSSLSSNMIYLKY